MHRKMRLSLFYFGEGIQFHSLFLSQQRQQVSSQLITDCEAQNDRDWGAMSSHVAAATVVAEKTTEWKI